MTVIRNVLFTLLLLSFILPLAGQEIRPVGIVHSSGPCFSFKKDPNDPQFAPENCIDGDLNTYSCFMDDTPTGTDIAANPAKGSEPVTGDVVFDLGKSAFVFGLKLTSPRKNFYAPKTVDVFCYKPGTAPPENFSAESLEDDKNITFILRQYQVPPIIDGQPHTIVFDGQETRYIGIRVHDAHDSGRQKYYIFQLAEVVCFGISPDEAASIDYTKLYINGEPFASLKNRGVEISRRNVDAFPISRLHADWIYQDHGKDMNACFTGDRFDHEQSMIQKVLKELAEYELPTAEYESRLKSLADAKTPGRSPEWSQLYYELCQIRREQRLAVFAEFPKEYLFAKHYVMGGRSGTFAMTADLTDSEVGNHGHDWRVGSELCSLKIGDRGKLELDVLLSSKEGIIRDPDISFNADKIAFAMKPNENEDYHLYIMNPQDRSFRQITFGRATADIEPCFLQTDDLIFSSTRCDQSAPCWWSDVLNLYACDAEGRFLRRLAFDQAHTVFPHVLEDGRVIYTRWEYNDRGPVYNQPLFAMNPDGTSQTEFYGNNSWSPTSIIHARGISGTQKVIAIASGHHNDQAGKLMIIDRKAGTQDGEGIELVAPERPFDNAPVDRFGMSGELFQYPYALDEDNYLVSFFPEGGVNGRDRRYDIPFGIYWMNREGRRELLVFDPTISSGQIIPFAKREKSIVKSTPVNLSKNDGTFFVQNVYIGPGLEGVPKGTVKKLRIVALEYRAVGTTHSYNNLYGQVTVPVSICNGSWDVKHILGTVDVEEDGSAFFTAPARTPLFFQLLDEKGRTVQTMRSWAMLLPGESFGCVGCHEDKNTNYFTDSQKLSLAMKKPPQNPVPFYKQGAEPQAERINDFNDSQRQAYEYLSVNAPQGMDRPRGFSYIREIQPIWDQHCVVCHSGQPDAQGKTVPMNLLGNAKECRWEDIWKPEYTFPSTPKYLYPQNGKDTNAARDFSESYLNLTHFGHKNDLIDWIFASSDPTMIKPGTFGSIKSRLMDYLEPEHYQVSLSPEEKEKVACWIDLCVPFCGSYMEANHWDKTQCRFLSRHPKELRGIYLYHEEKRLRHAEIEVAHLTKYKEYLADKKLPSIDEFPVYDFGGMEQEREFIQNYHKSLVERPVIGLAEGLDAHGGTNVTGNPRRNLAKNPGAKTFSVGSFPHAESNSFYQYLDEYSPASVIDGNGEANAGRWWRPYKRTDIWLKIEFGRTVLLDEIVIHRKLPESGRQGWSKVTLQFSDDQKEDIVLKNSPEPQKISFPEKQSGFVLLTDFQQEFPLETNGIIEIEVFGKDKILQP